MFTVSKGKDESYIRILPIGIRKKDGASAFQVRYYFENFEGKAWHLDSKLQKIKFSGESQFKEGTFSKGTSTTSEVEIPSGFSRIMDVYFTPPASIEKDAQLIDLQLNWQVKTAASTIKYVTSFIRTTVVEDPITNNAGPLRAAKGRR